MLSAIGLIIAIALLIVMIVKGVDMITASVSNSRDHSGNKRT